MAGFVPVAFVPMKPISKILLAATAIAPLVALAQPPARQVAAPKPTGQVSIVNAKDGTFAYDDKGGLAHWTKNVVITQQSEDIIIRAQDVSADRIRKIANASDQLSIETRDSTIKGKLLYADFNNRTAVITQSVVITSHGKNDGAAAGLRSDLAHKPIRVNCERVDWEYDIRQATATGNIHIAQGVNRGTCNKIVYDERKNIVDLLGDVRFGDDKNRTFIGQEVIVYIDEGRIQGKRGTKMLIPEGDALGSPSPRATKAPHSFAPAPTLPPLDGIAAPPPLPAPKPTATDEPVPTPRPDEPDDSAPQATATPTPTVAK